MRRVISTDPFRCCMWEHHDRLEQHINESTCHVEIASFLRHGQWYPLRDISDAEAIIAMDIENRHRVDISPYERGLSYRNWLRAGIFKSQEEISRKLGVSTAQVSRLLKLAQLPSVIVAAFKSPVDICETWAPDLADALEESKRRVSTCARARAIAEMPVRPEPREILRQLLTASGPGRKTKVSRRDEVVSDRAGKPLFRIRHLSNAIALLLPVQRVASDRLEIGVKPDVAVAASDALATAQKLASEKLMSQQH